MKKVITAGLTAAIIAGFSMASHAAPVKDMNVDISGVGQIINTWAEGAGMNDGLDLRRMRLTIKADPAEKVSFLMTADLTKNTAGDSKIVDMYVDLKYVPQATLRVGQFRLPNNYEINTEPYDKDLINDTMASFGTRDRGLQLSGSPVKEFSWSISATNGTGVESGAAVNSDDAALYLLQLNYMPVENLSFKIWGATEKDSTVIAAQEDSMGIGANYTVGGLHLYGEYNTTEQDTVLTNDLDQFYVTAAYKIPESNVSIVGRYEDVQQTVAGVAGDGNVFTAGVTLDFEKNARLQLNREIVDGADNDITSLQLSVKF